MSPAGRCCAILLFIALAACGGAPQRPEPGAHYTVRAGDTLYSIAWRHGLDYRDLARWNDIDNPALIFPGQTLRLTAPAAGASGRASAPRAPVPAPASRPPAVPKQAPPPARAASRIAWHWPAQGQVVARFGDRSSVGRGIDIAGRRGDAIHAAAAGRVVYAGSGLIGYGKLIIIKHDDTYLSAYGHNDTLLVEQGSEVRAGQPVATMGEGSGQRPLLHFEIRLDGKPVDPLQYLPQR